MEAQLAQLQATLNEMNQRSITQQEEMTVLRSQIIYSEQQRLVQQGIIQELQRKQDTELSRPRGGAEKSLIDTRGLSKPPIFKSEGGAKWKEFEFKYLNWLSLAFEDLRHVIKWVLTQTSPITDLSELEEDVKDAKEISRQLYNTLTQLLEGKSLVILQNSPPGNGFEVWRRRGV